MADRVLADKIGNIIRTGAAIVATGNPGCLLQIQAGLRAKNSQSGSCTRSNCSIWPIGINSENVI